MGYELDNAKKESTRNATVDAYMSARPKLDTKQNRKLFEDGFNRAWDICYKGTRDE